MRASLESYARATGGKPYFPKDTAELDGIFTEIVTELANQYVLSYSSTNAPPGRHVAADHREGQKRQLRHSSARRLSRQRSPAGRKVDHGQKRYRGFAVRGLAGSWVRGSIFITLAISAVTMLSAQQQPASPPQQQPQQAPAQPGQTPTFRSGVELVTVDVGVVDRQGQPVAA